MHADYMLMHACNSEKENSLLAGHNITPSPNLLNFYQDLIT